MGSTETHPHPAGLAGKLDSDLVRDGLAVGVIAGLGSGVPSTLHALATGGDPLEASIAAGTLLLPREERTLPLLVAAAPVHFGLSIGWGTALAALLPRRRTVLAGALAGLLIAALDLGLVGKRFERIRSLPLAPQIGDHVAFGVLAGAVIRRRRVTRSWPTAPSRTRKGRHP